MTEGRSPTSEGIDFGQFERGRHVNYWTLDPTLRRELRRVMATDEFGWAERRLESFGELGGHTVADNADRVDATGPELDPWNRYGEIQNFVRYPAEQLENDCLVYERGIVADAFEAPPGREKPMAMSHALGMLTLLSYADAGFGCPVAMTMGAAVVLRKFGDEATDPYYEALVSREYDDLIEGAMFLTEEQGGSDVGSIETTAEYDEESGYWRLAGEKWFCSNIDAEGTLALARTPDAPEGTAGLSMFLVPHADPEAVDGPLTKGDRYGTNDRRNGPAGGSDGALDPDLVNDQLYRRLKDKLGTISVPTGEVEFDGAKAILVGEEGAGFRQMAEMLNVERLANAAASCGVMGRALLESRVQAATREAFGSTIDEYPLMREDLVDMTVDYEAATAFTFEAAALLSRDERADRNEESGDGDGATEAETPLSGPTDPDRAARLLRALTPIAKLRTGRMAVDTASDAMEIQGGNGYVDDFVTHRLLRDAQVLPIWEGTENVLSLDLLRALDREDAHEPLLETIDDRLSVVSHPALADAVQTTREEYVALSQALATLSVNDDEYAQLSAKRLAHYVFDVYTAALLLAEAQADLDRDESDGENPAAGDPDPTENGDGRTALVARRFVETHLRDPDARGITSEERFPIEHFDAIVRYAPVSPSSLSVADEGE
ncbi:acyl-CoA dehydrogenase [Halovivax ruber XH-70]|uniref:Acyl-CoA dehydrogenase n=1 Tax=Halovivax ruber (strain DSM 18193 / JCM 13892 / XH-70) TaxID=797302 RepID=L0I5V5_HALRX|nr:acyl-CoA dehydrogenase family protein [Halovivax ruber]AGB14900.1 acyl-CoA dehydrogenase [Halovivax ruber XH-70]